MPIPPSTCHYFLISRLLAYFEIPCVTWLFYSLHVLSPCPDVSFVPPLRHKLTFFHFCFNILAKFGIGSRDNINIFFKRFIIKEEMCNWWDLIHNSTKKIRLPIKFKIKIFNRHLKKFWTLYRLNQDGRAIIGQLIHRIISRIQLFECEISWKPKSRSWNVKINEWCKRKRSRIWWLVNTHIFNHMAWSLMDDMKMWVG